MKFLNFDEISQLWWNFSTKMKFLNFDKNFQNFEEISRLLWNFSTLRKIFQLAENLNLMKLLIFYEFF